MFDDGEEEEEDKSNYDNMSQTEFDEFDIPEEE